MAYTGRAPSAAPLTSADINDGAVAPADLSTGAPSWTAGGAVTLPYNGSNKLATTSTGIDVTGTVTADGLTVDGNIDASYTGDTTTVVRTSHDGTTGLISSANFGTGYTDLDIEGKDVYIKRGIFGSLDAIKVEGATGDISFYEDTGTTPKFFWDASAESLGIGTSSPVSYSGQTSLTIGSTDVSRIDFYNGATHVADIDVYSGGGTGLILNNRTSLPMAFRTNNTERMRIDSSGNVGIGDTAPLDKLEVNIGNTTNTYSSTLTKSSNTKGIWVTTDANGDDSVGIHLATGGGTHFSSIMGSRTNNAAHWGTNLRFYTHSNTTSSINTATERMRITGEGVIVQAGSSTESSSLVLVSELTNNYRPIGFEHTTGGGYVGSVVTTSSGTTYNTTSDRRLKDNITTITDGKEKVLAMNPVNHTWIADPDAPAVHGFIAQEMKEIIPEAVTGDENSDEMMSMDYGRITPVIVAALQDALKEIEELKERINTLEAK